MDMILVISIRAGPEYRGKAIAGRSLHGEAKLPRRTRIGRPHHTAIREADRANVERTGKAVLAQFSPGEPITAAAGAKSWRTKDTTSSAISQRNVAGGSTATSARSERTIRSRWMISGPPHSPGPLSSPSGLNTARSLDRRIWQAVGVPS